MRLLGIRVPRIIGLVKVLAPRYPPRDHRLIHLAGAGTGSGAVRVLPAPRA